MYSFIYGAAYVLPIRSKILNLQNLQSLILTIVICDLVINSTLFYFQDIFNKDVFLQLSYLGPGVAAIISIRLFKMEKSSFINKMFLLYFSLDIFAGLVHTFYLQKMVTEK